MQQERTMGTLRGLLILAGGALGGLTNGLHMTQQHFDWAVGMRHYTVCLIAALCLHPPILHAQEAKHAPTVEQCRADQKLWLPKVEDEPGVAGYRELDEWVVEMTDCLFADQRNENEYHKTIVLIKNEQLGRLLHFLDRHNLHDQFIAEDAQGKR